MFTYVLAHRRQTAILITAGMAAMVSQAFGRFTYSLLFTSIRDSLGVSNSRAGSLGSANLVAYLVGTLVVMVVVGRLGLNRTIRYGLAGVTIGLVILGWSSRYTTVLGGLVLTGLFAAGVWVTAPGIAAAQVAPERRGVAVGVVGGLLGAGIVASSALNTVLGRGRWHDLYKLQAGIAVVTLLIAAALLRPERGADAVTRRRGLAAIRQVDRWRSLLASYGLFGTAMALNLTFLVAVLHEDAGWTTAQASFAFSCFGLGTVVGGPLIGWMADRFSPRFALVCANGSSVAAAAVVVSGARPWATIAAACLGATFTGVPTTIAAAVAEAVEPASFGAAYGAATLAFGAGISFAPQLGGLIRDQVGSFRPIYLVSGLCSLAAAAAVGRRREATGERGGRRVLSR